MLHPTEDSKFTQVNAAASAGTGTTNTTGLDMSGYERVQWIVPIVTVLNTATIAVQVQDSADNSSFANAGDSLTITSGADNDKNNMLILVSAARPDPDRKYVRLVITRGTANSAFGVVVSRRFNPSVPQAISQSASEVAGSLVLNNPR